MQRGGFGQQRAGAGGPGPGGAWGDSGRSTRMRQSFSGGGLPLPPGMSSGVTPMGARIDPMRGRARGASKLVEASAAGRSQVANLQRDAAERNKLMQKNLHSFKGGVTASHGIQMLEGPREIKSNFKAKDLSRFNTPDVTTVTLTTKSDFDTQFTGSGFRGGSGYNGMDDRDAIAAHNPQQLGILEDNMNMMQNNVAQHLVNHQQHINALHANNQQREANLNASKAHLQSTQSQMQMLQNQAAQQNANQQRLMMGGGGGGVGGGGGGSNFNSNNANTVTSLMAGGGGGGDGGQGTYASMTHHSQAGHNMSSVTSIHNDNTGGAHTVSQMMAHAQSQGGGGGGGHMTMNPVGGSAGYGAGGGGAYQPPPPNSPPPGGGMVPANGANAAAPSSGVPGRRGFFGRRKKEKPANNPGLDPQRARDQLAKDLKTFYKKHNPEKANDQHIAEVLNSYPEDELIWTLEKQYKAKFKRTVAKGV